VIAKAKDKGGAVKKFPINQVCVHACTHSQPHTHTHKRQRHGEIREKIRKYKCQSKRFNAFVVGVPEREKTKVKELSMNYFRKKILPSSQLR
jgi:hypothetical protein